MTTGYDAAQDIVNNILNVSKNHISTRYMSVFLTFDLERIKLRAHVTTSILPTAMIDEKRLYELLGARLRRLRESHVGSSGKLTQAALAQAIGLERTSITNIERGNQKVPLHVLYRICEVLQVSIFDLLPPPTEAQQQVIDSEVGEVNFQGRNVVTTPRVAKLLTQLTNLGERNEQDE